MSRLFKTTFAKLTICRNNSTLWFENVVNRNDVDFVNKESALSLLFLNNVSSMLSTQTF